jgi:hypothetical protein
MTLASDIKQGTNLNRWILFFQVVILMVLMFKFRLSTQIEREVIKNQVQAELAEKHLLDFMQKTVERWEKLARDNPDVKVPKVTPPNTPP